MAVRQQYSAAAIKSCAQHVQQVLRTAPGGGPRASWAAALAEVAQVLDLYQLPFVPTAAQSWVADACAGSRWALSLAFFGPRGFFASHDDSIAATTVCDDAAGRGVVAFLALRSLRDADRVVRLAVGPGGARRRVSPALLQAATRCHALLHRWSSALALCVANTDVMREETLGHGVAACGSANKPHLAHALMAVAPHAVGPRALSSALVHCTRAPWAANLRLLALVRSAEGRVARCLVRQPPPTAALCMALCRTVEASRATWRAAATAYMLIPPADRPIVAVSALRVFDLLDAQTGPARANLALPQWYQPLYDVSVAYRDSLDGLRGYSLHMLPQMLDRFLQRQQPPGSAPVPATVAVLDANVVLRLLRRGPDGESPVMEHIYGAGSDPARVLCVVPLPALREVVRHVRVLDSVVARKGPRAASDASSAAVVPTVVHRRDMWRHLRAVVAARHWRVASPLQHFSAAATVCGSTDLAALQPAGDVATSADGNDEAVLRYTVAVQRAAAARGAEVRLVTFDEALRVRAAASGVVCR